MRLLAGCVLAQTILVQLTGPGWWQPDLLTMGLLIAVIHQPSRWLTYSMLVGYWAALWAIRMPAVVWLSYVVLAWGVVMAIRRWDIDDRRALAATIGTGSALILGAAIWADNLWSWPLAGWWGVRVAVTMLVVRCLPQRWMAR